MLDFFLNVIWLPIGTANTIGFRTTHEAFMTTYNGTGAPPGWNWCLSYLATAGILIGFDASGHVAEETKNASVTAARGIFWSTVASGFGGLATIILFLFCAVRHFLFSLSIPELTSRPALRGSASGVWLGAAVRSALRCSIGPGRPHFYEHHLRCCIVAGT